VGIVQARGTGRPSHLYARFPCKAREADHLYRITEFRLCFLGCPFRPGSRASETEPDGWLTLAGEELAVEIDCGTMTRNQMQAKWRRYDGCPSDILVVTVSESRMQRLRAQAETVRDRALFTTFQRLREGRPWVDWHGNTATL